MYDRNAAGRLPSICRLIAQPDLNFLKGFDATRTVHGRFPRPVLLDSISNEQ
jgi:hypothetical protein